MWILENPRSEFLFLYLPGIASVVLSVLFPDLGEASLFYGILATGLIDSGHVYTTVWRTWFHPEERTSSAAYWVFPLLFLGLFTLWYALLPGLWAFVVYSTIFHHVRQIYGLSKWYQVLNQRRDSRSDLFLYALTVFPFVIYHFRSGAIAGYYSPRDLFLFPHEGVRMLLHGIYLVVLVLWMIYEFSLYRSGIREVNRILSVGFPSLIYAYCFLQGQTLTQILFPLLFIHGVAYFGIMGQSLRRTQKRFKNEGSALLIVLMTALIFGGGESWFESYVLDRGSASWGTALLVGLSLTPLYCHYAFDALIWKKSHRESGLVFGSGP